MFDSDDAHDVFRFVLIKRNTRERRIFDFVDHFFYRHVDVECKQVAAMVHNVVNFDVVQIKNAFKHFAFFLDFFTLIHVYCATDFGNGGVFAVFARGVKFEQAESKIDDFLEYVSQRRKDGNPEIDHRRDDQSNGVGVFYRIAFGQHVGINKNQNRHNNRSVGDAFAAKQLMRTLVASEVAMVLNRLEPSRVVIISLSRCLNRRLMVLAFGLCSFFS